jgi:hypothetical protein
MMHAAVVTMTTLTASLEACPATMSTSAAMMHTMMTASMEAVSSPRWTARGSPPAAEARSATVRAV